jgi:hypothetical protein
MARKRKVHKMKKQKKNFTEQNKLVPKYARKDSLLRSMSNASPFCVIPDKAFPELKDCMKKIAAELPLKDKLKSCRELRVLFYNLDIVSKVSKGCFVSKKMGYWNDFNRIREKDTKFSLMRLNKVIAAMKKKGYLVEICGMHCDKNKFRTTVFATLKFKKAMSEAWNEFVERKNIEEIVLHNEKKEDIAPVDAALPEKVRKRKEIVKKLNSVQSEHIYTFDPGYHRIKMADGSFRMEEKHSLVRFSQVFSSIYKYDFTKGGRFYARPLIGSANYQTMSKKVRKSIRIDGEKIVEMDYCSMHIAIAYALAKMPWDNKRDAYGFLPENQRDIAKKALLISINSISRKQAIYAFLQDCGYDKGYTYHSAKELVFLPMEEYHKALSMLLYKSESCLGLTLQNFDSIVMEKLIDECLSSAIPVLPVHDSLICKRSDAGFVREKMLKVFKSVFGVACKVAA